MQTYNRSVLKYFKPSRKWEMFASMSINMLTEDWNESKSIDQVYATRFQLL